MQSQAARIVRGTGLVDLLAVDQRVRVDDTGGQSANRHHRLIDRTGHVYALGAVVDQRAQRVGAELGVVGVVVGEVVGRVVDHRQDFAGLDVLRHHRDAVGAAALIRRVGLGDHLQKIDTSLNGRALQVLVDGGDDGVARHRLLDDLAAEHVALGVGGNQPLAALAAQLVLHGVLQAALADDVAVAVALQLVLLIDLLLGPVGCSSLICSRMASL